MSYAERYEKKIQSESEMVKAVHDLESGTEAESVARDHDISRATLYNWYSKYNVPLVAHNASFDSNCLRAVLRAYKMEDPGYWFLDTLVASRECFGDILPNHKLPTVAAA